MLTVANTSHQILPGQLNDIHANHEESTEDVGSMFFQNSDKHLYATQCYNTENQNSQPQKISCNLLLYHSSTPSSDLASPMTDAHSVPSKALVLHLFTPIFLKSNLTSSIYLNRSPFFLPPPGWPLSNFFTVLSPSILTTYPRHSNLHTLTTVTVFGQLNLL